MQDEHFKKLPTQWLILTREGKLLATDIGRLTLARLTEKYPDAPVLLAKCHYAIGSDGQRQYYLAFKQMAEAQVVMLDPEYPTSPTIGQRFYYGQEKTTKEITKG